MLCKGVKTLIQRIFPLAKERFAESNALMMRNLITRMKLFYQE